MRNQLRHRREAGTAMFVAVLLLVIMGALGIAAMDTVTRDRQVAGFQNRTRGAFYAAEAGAAHGRSLVVEDAEERTSTVLLPTTTLGDTTLYDRETQRPTYYPDPAVAGANPNGIRYLRDGGESKGMNEQEGNVKFVDTLWQINVRGQSANALGSSLDGRASTARIEVIETKTMAGGGSY